MGQEQGGFAGDARRVAEAERWIQREVEAQEERSFQPGGEDSPPPQTGARPYPAPPFPGKHLEKPGLEADLTLKPMFDAPYYRGSGKLEGRVALITGGDSGIGLPVVVLSGRAPAKAPGWA